VISTKRLAFKNILRLQAEIILADDYILSGRMNMKQSEIEF